jgi:MoaA/NifB/PqqE/SkfB family radical SAM enzyme
MCDLPKEFLYGPRGESRDGRELDTSEMKAVIDDFATIGTVGLSFTGGEPTMRPDCFELLAHAARTGMLTHLNTNGYNMHRPERVEALLATGLASMNFSLDAATAETHNRIRNAEYGFERIAKGTELILGMRRGDTPSVTYTFVVSPASYREIPAFVAMSRARGVTSVSFLPVLACYRDAKPIDDGTAYDMQRTIDWLRDEKARDRSDFIDNSDEYLALLPKAFRAEPSPIKCFVGYHHILVDCYGGIYACALMYQSGRRAGDVQETPLREFWGGPVYQSWREKLEGCRDCFWNCHTEINLLYQGGR